MIWESWPWKREIVRLAFALQRRKNQKKWRQNSYAKLEQEIFFAAYAVRKLIDAFKISDEVESLYLVGVAHPCLNRIPDIGNRKRIDELYDLSKSKAYRISLEDFCNQVIHSFVFEICVCDDTGGLAGLFLASDRQKEKSLLYFDIDAIVELLMAVVRDNVVYMMSVRDAVGKPLRIVKKSNRSDIKFKA